MLLGLRIRQSFPRMPLSSLPPLSCRPLSTTSSLLARGRGRYLKDGSNRQEISAQTRELIEKARDTDDKSWQLGPGVEEPISLDLSTEERTRALQYEVPYRGYAKHVDNGVEGIKYFPHTGESLPSSPPSPVLMVTKTKRLYGEQYWVKQYCEQLGLGGGRPRSSQDLPPGTRVFLPNLPSVCLLLFKIKHVVDIQPLTFPNGLPDDFDPSRQGCQLTHRGEFVVGGPPAEALESVALRAEWMKIKKEHYVKEARHHWTKGTDSPLGNSNYHRNSAWLYSSKKDPEFVKNQKKQWS